MENYRTIKDKRSALSTLAKLFVIVGLSILVCTWFNTGKGWASKPDSLDLNEWTIKSYIGTYLGGIVGSLFSLSGFFLLYLTFQSQKDAFLKERFENKFFELVKLHRENVKEFNIGNRVKGRACFVSMLNEFHYIYNITSKLGAITSKTDKHYLNYIDEKRDEAIVDFAFKIFFFGAGFNSEQQLKHFVSEREFGFYLDMIKPRLTTIQEGYLEFENSKLDGYFEYNPPLEGGADEWTFETNCYPFDGHSIRLGHYFRQLFQAVKFVDKQDGILSAVDKRFYIKTLRAQLSNQEQLLLYYDSLSEFGREWFTNGYFLRYSFLKNIPLALVKVKPHPHKKIGIYNEHGKFIFEWDKHSASKGKKIEDPL